MKRYDDVNIIKAYACLAVFGSHWFGTFGSWGSNKVNALMEIGPLPLFRYGTFGVSLFLIISGMLIADKVYSGRSHFCWHIYFTGAVSSTRCGLRRAWKMSG